MCRLFGLSSQPRRTRATFWLEQAPDNLEEQSRRNPDGTGIGYFDADGGPQVDKAPLPAWQDPDFERDARTVVSTTFVAHVRYASTGALTRENTHPFEMAGRLFAHNGVIQDLDRLERELGPAMSLVHGATDSERFFALITARIDAAGGDVAAGIRSAVRWVAAELPVLALNFVMIDADNMWALRYPATHELHMLHRSPGGQRGDQGLRHRGRRGGIAVASPTDLASSRAVVVASEPMDDDPGWRPLSAGELLHVRPGLGTTSQVVIAEPPARLLTLAELEPGATASQRPR